MPDVAHQQLEERINLYNFDWLQEARFETFSMNAGPFLGRQEIREDGSSRFWLAVQVADKHLNGLGFCHGGVLLTLADDALGINAYHAVNKKSIPTASLQANFLQGVRKGDFLEATTTDIHVTNSLVFVQGCAMVGDRQVATMNAIFKILK